MTATPLAARNAAILDALAQPGATLRDVAQVYNLTERRVRDIRQRYAAQTPNGNGAGKGATMGEIGLSGLKYNSGYVQEEILRNLSSWSQRHKVFTQMRQDPVVAASLLSIELAVRMVEWRMEGEDERADFVEECRTDTSHTWNDHISDALTMIPYGWQWSEIVYKRRQGAYNAVPSNYADGRIGWRKFAGRAQGSLHEWVFNERGDVQAMVQSTYPTFELLTIPLEKSLLYRTTRESNNPEGRSLLRAAYESYYYASNLRTIEAISAERDLAGLPYVKLPNGADTLEGSKDITAAEKIVRRVRQDEQAGVVVPDGWEFGLLSSPGSKQMSIGDIITRYEKRTAMSLLAQFIMVGMDSVGSYALSKDKSDFFVLAVSTFADIIAETFNQFAIPRLLKLNGMALENPPHLEHGALGTPDIEAIARAFSLFTSAGIIKPDGDLEQHVRKMLDAPELTDVQLEQREQDEIAKREQAAELRERLAGAEGNDQRAQDESKSDEQLPPPPPASSDKDTYAVESKSVRQKINSIPDKKLKRRINKGAQELGAFNDALLGESLARLNATTDDEWQRALDADKERHD